MWRGDLAGLLTGFNPQLERRRFADALEAAIDARTAAIRADTAHSAKAFARLQEAAARSADLATVLARGISAQDPDNFGA
jgi:hypothetical protein